MKAPKVPKVKKPEVNIPKIKKKSKSKSSSSHKKAKIETEKPKIPKI